MYDNFSHSKVVAYAGLFKFVLDMQTTLDLACMQVMLGELLRCHLLHVNIIHVFKVFIDIIRGSAPRKLVKLHYVNTCHNYL